jgi:hypothetical protein
VPCRLTETAPIGREACGNRARSEIPRPTSHRRCPHDRTRGAPEAHSKPSSVMPTSRSPWISTGIFSRASRVRWRRSWTPFSEAHRDRPAKLLLSDRTVRGRLGARGTLSQSCMWPLSRVARAKVAGGSGQSSSRRRARRVEDLPACDMPHVGNKLDGKGAK